MSSVVKIDQNDKPTWIAYNETTGLTEPVACDPVTNVLYVYGVPVDSNTPTAITRALIDSNDNATQIAYNETTGNVECLRCGTDGSLLIIPQ